MSTTWSPTRLKAAFLGLKAFKYEVLPVGQDEMVLKMMFPNTFGFEGISAGDASGQAFIVPLDESSMETAQYILRAIEAYEGE